MKNLATLSGSESFFSQTFFATLIDLSAKWCASTEAIFRWRLRIRKMSEAMMQQNSRKGKKVLSGKDCFQSKGENPSRP
jgi:hypothetical protein